MSVSLAALRQTPQLTPAQFLTFQPGCWIQYFDDDTSAKDPAKALGTAVFDPAVARRKQAERCAVCFSLQAFGKARTRQELLCYRNMGVDVDLLGPAEKRLLSPEQIDARKDAYLAERLWPFPLEPHWIVETRHGFHLVYRVQPQRGLTGIRAAAALNERLVRALRGDEHATLLTQVLRVPGTFQFKEPRCPFLCRLLFDRAAQVVPYDLDTVRAALDAWETSHGEDGPGPSPHGGGPGPQPPRWKADLGGVAEGGRNVAAASLVGGILGRLPTELWETAGWGGLKEWNRHNAVPLPDRELRCVFESIARREKARRYPSGPAAAPAPPRR